MGVRRPACCALYSATSPLEIVFVEPPPELIDCGARQQIVCVPSPLKSMPATYAENGGRLYAETLNAT